MEQFRSADDWWRAAFKKGGGPIDSVESSHEDDDHAAPAEPELLSSTDQKLLAQEVEKYDKKLQEDRKNRPNRVLGLLTELEHQVLEADEASSKDADETVGQPLPETRSDPLTVSSSQNPDKIAGDEYSSTKTSMDETPSEATILTLSSTIPSGTKAATKVTDEGVVVPESKRPAEDRDVLEIEITRQDPIPTGSGGVQLIKAKQVTIQVIIKRRKNNTALPRDNESIPHLRGESSQGNKPCSNTAKEMPAANEMKEEEELFFAQENEAIACDSCVGGDDGAQGIGTPEEELQKVERELTEKMQEMAKLQRDINRLEARREGFLRAASRMGPKQTLSEEFSS